MLAQRHASVATRWRLWLKAMPPTQVSAGQSAQPGASETASFEVGDAALAAVAEAVAASPGARLLDRCGPAAAGDDRVAHAVARECGVAVHGAEPAVGEHAA